LERRAARGSAGESGGGPDGAKSPWVQLRSATMHPFIYKRMVGAVDPAATAGDVVYIYDKAGRFFGQGLYHPVSQIAVRVLAHDDAPIDDAFWRAAIGRAVAHRRSLGLDETTDAYRVIHAEGDRLSGLVVERYADCLVMEFFSLGMYQRRALIGRLLSEAMGPPPAASAAGGLAVQWRIVHRADAQIERIEGFRIDRGGEVANRRSVTIRESGVRYRVDVAAGHKTGFFCDQRDNRRRFAGLCRGRDVLDVCCYTGGFGISAKAQGGAAEVVCVDLDEAALAVAGENVRLNNVRVKTVHSDAFIYLRQMIENRRSFGAVVVDPPKFATSRPALDDALKKYHDLNRLACQVVEPWGVLLTCSCSGLVSRDRFFATVGHSARAAGRKIQVFDESGAAADHPVAPECPESGYLKCLWLRVQ
jgi:23S rRNA (cytosine1962-C5)-methyltransferase